MKMNTSADPAGAGVLRGRDADGLRRASFSVDLRRAVPAPARPGDADESARAAGYARGWAQGQRDAAPAEAEARAGEPARAQAADAARQAALHRALRAVDTAASALHDELSPAVARLEELLLDAAYQVAQALLGRELSTTEPGRDALARALALAPPDGPVTVRLSPADHAALAGPDGSTVEHQVAGRIVTLVADPSLRPGDALAQCGNATIDARLAEALARVRAVLS